MSHDVVTSEQLEFYETNGYLQLESFVDAAWMAELRSASDEFVEESRQLATSSRRFDLEVGHSTATPRLRRLVSPVDLHETFHRLAFEGPVAQLAMAILGGPVRFHHSKLNYKWSGGGEEVKWHQDIQFWPHTDFTPLTIGVYLDDVDDEMGPMGVLPGSHTGKLYDLYSADGSWSGAMRDDDIATLPMEDMAWLQGPAGSVTVHNCCMVHGSMPNHSDHPRPLLLQTYSALTSYPVLGIGANGVDGAHSGRIVGGTPSQDVTVQGRAMRGAPDWRKQGPPTIFGSQQADS